MKQLGDCLALKVGAVPEGEWERPEFLDIDCMENCVLLEPNGIKPEILKHLPDTWCQIIPNVF
eukprot:622937-Amphidinium_carterae.1